MARRPRKVPAAWSRLSEAELESRRDRFRMHPDEIDVIRTDDMAREDTIQAIMEEEEEN